MSRRFISKMQWIPRSPLRCAICRLRYPLMMISPWTGTSSHDHKPFHMIFRVIKCLQSEEI